MNLTPVLRFSMSFAILALAVGGGYFLSEPTSKAFLYGASIMLLLPLTLVFLLDAARRAKLGAAGPGNRVCWAVLAIPLAALAFCSFAVGAYLLVSLVSGSAPNTWINVVAGVLVAVMFIAFGIKLFRVLWCRYHDAILP